MISITVNDKSPKNLISYQQMLNSPDGTIFQLYHKGEFCPHYYVSFGPLDGMVTIYLSDNKWRMSTTTEKDLKGLYSDVRFGKIDAKLEMNLRIN